MVNTPSSDPVNLGFLLDTHRKKYRFHISVGLLLTANGLVAAFVGASLADNWIALSFSGVLVFAFGLIQTCQGIAYRRISVDLYTNGFVYKTRHKSIALPWHAIDDIVIHIDRRPRRPRYAYIISTKSEQRLTIDRTLERHEDLGESMMHNFSWLHGNIWDKRRLDKQWPNVE